MPFQLVCVRSIRWRLRSCTRSGSGSGCTGGRRNRSAGKEVFGVGIKGSCGARLGVALGMPCRYHPLEQQSGKVAAEHDPILQAASVLFLER